MKKDTNNVNAINDENIETKLKKLAERAVKGEIPLELWWQLPVDLQLEHPENKKKIDLVGYA